MPQKPLYERDFYAWAHEQAGLLRSGDLALADIVHIAEEIESMGKTEKRELASRLTVLLAHLLKWRYQPGKRGPSWRATIRIQRVELEDHLADNPSLRSQIPEILARAYTKALIDAGVETGLPETSFPDRCPWTFQQVLDDQYWPD